MAMGRVRARFLYAQTQLAGLYLLLELGPFNKWVFLFASRLAPPGPMGLTGPIL